MQSGPHRELIPHLFRTEYRKIVAVLTRHFGFEQVEMAEDVASETFLAAAQTWGLQGPPPNPTAWLYHVAKNKARNLLYRQSVFNNNVRPLLAEEPETVSVPDIDLSPGNISDSQLQMMFAVCHPAISPEAQVGLSLRILCGFGIEEIADAFLSNKETISKRLFRAKEKLRQENIKVAFPSPHQMQERIEHVLTTIYLLFNEGYYSVSHDSVIRSELCVEAMRLCSMLIENEQTDRPAVNALMSLMCFHASRLEARVDQNGGQILYDEQDVDQWNKELIARGTYFFRKAASGSKLSRYHLEAGIAYWNTQKADTQEKWSSILTLYNQLLVLEYSPIAALNRSYALSKLKGKQTAIAEAEKLNLTNNHFYHTLLGELYTNIDDHKAVRHFEQALTLARTQHDQNAINKKLFALVGFSKE